MFTVKWYPSKHDPNKAHFTSGLRSAPGQFEKTSEKQNNENIAKFTAALKYARRCGKAHQHRKFLSKSTVSLSTLRASPYTVREVDPADSRPMELSSMNLVWWREKSDHEMKMSSHTKHWGGISSASIPSRTRRRTMYPRYARPQGIPAKMWKTKSEN